MDLELTDEQKWLAESVATLLSRAWPAPEGLDAATADDRRRLWRELVEFGALSIGGDDGLGAVELCLIARALGSALAVTPLVASAAVRLALAPLAAELPVGEDAIALGLLEPGASWGQANAATTLQPLPSGDYQARGEKVAVELSDEPAWIAVSARLEDAPALALVRADAAGLTIDARPSIDASLRTAAVSLDQVTVASACVIPGAEAVARIHVVGALLAAAEAIGAAGSVFELARRYAGERRQFGRTIGSFQALRHILADMYVRQASGWSTVLYAAAAFDDGAEGAAQVAQVAKAYVSRGAREVAHDAMQVFGGIAFTDEHPAHRFLRRIIVREQQFGDATHHERALGRALAHRFVAAGAGS